MFLARTLLSRDMASYPNPKNLGLSPRCLHLLALALLAFSKTRVLLIPVSGIEPSIAKGKKGETSFLPVLKERPSSLITLLQASMGSTLVSHHTESPSKSKSFRKIVFIFIFGNYFPKFVFKTPGKRVGFLED
jgi:hypothetical protein